MNNTPLNPEELKSHRDFIYDSVMDNIVLRSAGKFARELNLTVQDLVHSNVTTLRQIGSQIEKVAQEAGSSEFSHEGPFKISGVPASAWINFLKLQIRIKKVQEDAADKKARIATLAAQIDDLKTPEEKRKSLEAEYNALLGLTAQEAVS
jgi:hypothetical protein